MKLRKPVRMLATIAIILSTITLGFSLDCKVNEVKSSKIIPYPEEQETVKPWLFYSNAEQSLHAYESPWYQFEKSGISLISNFSIVSPTFKLKDQTTGSLVYRKETTILNAWRYEFFAQTHIFMWGRVFATQL